eukprot:1934254-Pyramimonas_sp.AAC.1
MGLLQSGATSVFGPRRARAREPSLPIPGLDASGVAGRPSCAGQLQSGGIPIWAPEVPPRNCVGRKSLGPR